MLPLSHGVVWSNDAPVSAPPPARARSLLRIALPRRRARPAAPVGCGAASEETCAETPVAGPPAVAAPLTPTTFDASMPALVALTEASVCGPVKVTAVCGGNES